MSTNPEEEGTSKVILWAVPRSLSTCLTKCLSFVPDSTIWFEPYIGALWYGKDARFPPPCSPTVWKGEPGMDLQTQAAAVMLPDNSGHDASQISYDWCKNQLEEEPGAGDSPGRPSQKKVVFVKAMSFAISERFGAIPRGYKHTFLIRHPAKVFRSYKAQTSNESQGGIDNNNADDYNGTSTRKLTECRQLDEAPGYFFKESYDLYRHVQETYDPHPVIIDADDLQTNPGGLLKAYCDAVGIPFSDDLLRWDRSDDVTLTWKIRRGVLQQHRLANFTFLEKAFSSCEFQKPDHVKENIDVRDLPEDIRQYVNFAMPFYEKMYKERLTC